MFHSNVLYHIPHSIIRYCELHLLLVWAVTMMMIEFHNSEIQQENFITAIVMVMVIIIVIYNY